MVLLAVNQHPLSIVLLKPLVCVKVLWKNNILNQVKEKNVIRLLENNVGRGGGVENNPGWDFSNEYFLEPS